jgi:hypothetical protein
MEGKRVRETKKLKHHEQAYILVHCLRVIDTITLLDRKRKCEVLFGCEEKRSNKDNVA